jgi:hypothetical protein
MSCSSHGKLVSVQCFFCASSNDETLFGDRKYPKIAILNIGLFSLELRVHRITHPRANTAVTSPDCGQFWNVEFKLEEATMAISMIFLGLSVVLHVVEAVKPNGSREMVSHSIYHPSTKGIDASHRKCWGRGCGCSCLPREEKISATMARQQSKGADIYLLLYYSFGR